MKLRANEYCACIGFSENKAVVNKKAAKQYKRYNVERFLEEGLLRQAFSLAYYKEDNVAMEQVLKVIQESVRSQGEPLPGRSIPQEIGDLIKLFGNIPVPEQLGGVFYV